LKRFLEMLLAWLRQEQRLDIVDEGSRRLVLRHGGTTTHVDGTRRQVWQGREPARPMPFQAIAHVETRYREIDDSPPYWEVRLRLASGSVMEVGASSDDAEASVAAARIATLVGCPVRAS